MGWDKIETHARIDLPEVLDFLYGAIALVDGAPPALATAVVPEPASLAIAICVVFVLCGARRRRAAGSPVTCK